MNRTSLNILLLGLGVYILFPLPTHAVIPPDFIFNVGSQLVQIFSIVVLFFSAVFGVVWQFLKTRFAIVKYKKLILVGSGIIIILISLGIAYLYDQHRQIVEYKKWLLESKEYSLSGSDTSTFSIENAISLASSTPIVTSTFFENHHADQIVITNQKFKELIMSSTTDYLVVDAREDIEYENGYFPTSTHIRFADLKAGEWTKFSQDKLVIVICWSGIRGKETAEFLRSKGIVASYLENGASGWVEFGGIWVGNIKFAQKYSDRRFELVFSTDQVKQKIEEGIILVDSREPIKFAKKHIAGSVSISMFNTATRDLLKAFSQIPLGSKVITVCDEYVNCFDAKVTGVELEKRGFVFLGRYNKPWDF
jgi:rhodanese-related sulfurtransferase